MSSANPRITGEAKTSTGRAIATSTTREVRSRRTRHVGPPTCASSTASVAVLSTGALVAPERPAVSVATVPAMVAWPAIGICPSGRNTNPAAPNQLPPRVTSLPRQLGSRHPLLLGHCPSPDPPVVRSGSQSARLRLPCRAAVPAVLGGGHLDRWVGHCSHRRRDGCARSPIRSVPTE